MNDINRRELTFRQAEGLDPLPGPLSLGMIGEEARALIWAAVHTSVSTTAETDYNDNPIALGTGWSNVMGTWWVRRDFRPADEFNREYHSNHNKLKMMCLNWEMTNLFDFLTFALRHPSRPMNLEEDLSWAFQESRMAYRLEEQTIWPAATPEEGETIHRALTDLAAIEYGGARSHLKRAGSLIGDGDWAGSIRESIHAVESVAVLIEPSAKTLSDALKKLTNADKMNPNLKAGLERLYAYTSDEKGIRHAKVYEDVRVDQADAVYMLGACAAFTSFLLARRPLK